MVGTVNRGSYAYAVPTKNSIRLKIIELSSLATEGSVLLANRTDDRVPGRCSYKD
jgi:hypothetical protein